MKNKVLLCLCCLPCFLFSASPSKIEKLTETADTYYQTGKIDSALWAIDQAIQQALADKDTCHIVSCYTSQGVYLRSSGKSRKQWQPTTKPCSLPPVYPKPPKKTDSPLSPYTTTWQPSIWT